MTELKPCPFCGRSVYAIQDTTLLCGHRYWYIRHKNSDCILGDNFRSRLYTTKEELMRAWNNTRIPTADTVEVKHAKLELVNNGTGVCSNCHRLDSIDKLAQYCRYCGAKID